MCKCSNNYYSGNGYTTNYTRSYSGPNGYENVNYANAYVPNQVLNSTFSPMEGLSRGTMFPELVSYYQPGQSMEEINYLRYGRGGCM